MNTRLWAKEDDSLYRSAGKAMNRGYQLSYELACKQLQSIADIEQQCLKVGASCEVAGPKKIVTLRYLNRSYRVIIPDIRIVVEGSDEEVPLRDKILILHYLAQGKGTPLCGKVIAYKELGEAATYFPTFSKRTLKPIIENFGTEPQLLLEAAASIGGWKAEYGDVAVTINAFDRVPITFVVWRGDEEFPAAANILFDRSVTDYLPTEDIIVACEVMAWKLVRSVRSRG